VDVVAVDQELALEAADVPSTMIVGVHGLADETPRVHEYSTVFDAELFAAHEKFFVHDVRRWVRCVSESRCPPSVRRCSVCRRVENSRSLLGFGIPTSTVRSSPARRARVTSRLA
jgi:hypothetical protein